MHKRKYFFQNKVSLIRGGKEYFNQVVNLINKATQSIHLQTYIYESDETGILVADALIAAAKRNIEVYLLIDGYASKNLPEVFKKELEEGGVHFRFFEPLFKSKYFYFGRRLHHKILVIDNRVALIGGINISNRYNDLLNKPAWLDFTLLVEGEIATEICILCWKTWKGFPLNMDLTICEKNKTPLNFNNNEIATISMRRNDWVRRKNEISETYIQMLLHAKSHITILCSYFLPGKVIRKLFSDASKRGVSINIITAGKSDVMVAKHAERWLYDYLLRNNIKIYEYQPTILHAKMAICDSEWLTLGSYNINDISAYASIELNLDVFNTSFTLETEKKINYIIQEECVEVTKESHINKKNLLVQFTRWLSYQSIRLIFNLVTFYYKRISYKKKAVTD